MMSKSALLRGVALGAMFVAIATTAAAKPVHHKKRTSHSERASAVTPIAPEVNELRSEVQQLRATVEAQAQAQAALQSQIAQQQSQVAQVVSDNQSVEARLDSVPQQVLATVGELPKPKTDGWYFKGVKFTPGGFIAAESVYRSRGLGSDFSLPMGSIPYAGSSLKSARGSEWRQTARQSRVSGLAEADATPDLKLTAYGELDFLGAADTANSNESNSYNLRIRHLYTTVDSKSTGLSLLAGQNWSLVTMNDKGITPRNEVVPLTIEAQYAVGFVWARQPQIRLTENFGNGFWLAASVENPQTNSIGGGAALVPGYGTVVFNQAGQGGSLFSPNVNYSFNHVPDVVGKVAYDNTLAGRHVHVEGFGIYRDFRDRVGTGCNTAGAACTAFSNVDSTGGGGGFGLTGQIIPSLLDGQVSGLFGKGIGRYGSSQLSDVYEKSDGSLDGINESILFAGLTLHATPMLDVYGYVGQEDDQKSSYNVGTAHGGYGNPLFSNLGGCELASNPACSGNTRFTQEATIGLWDKVFSGDIGSFRFGLQYSYTRRVSFSGQVSATPLGYSSVKGDDSMIYTSIRYYPFQK